MVLPPESSCLNTPPRGFCRRIDADFGTVWRRASKATDVAPLHNEGSQCSEDHKEARLRWCPLAGGSPFSRATELRVQAPREKHFHGKLRSFGKGAARAKQLHMDHVYLPFLDFLSGITYLGINAGVFAFIKAVRLRTRQVFEAYGIIKAAAHDPKKVVGRLLLDFPSFIIHYSTRSSDGKTLGFAFERFPVITADNKCVIHDLLTCEVDVASRQLVSATLDGVSLTPTESMGALCFYAVSAAHVKTHALANWGTVPVDAGDAVAVQNSCVSAVYNWFGFVMFSKFFPVWRLLGLLPQDQHGAVLAEVFKSGLETGVRAHPHVLEMQQHSKVADFVIRARGIFHDEFRKHEHFFPGVDPECMFIGSALHSLDHHIYETILANELWLSRACPRFGRVNALNQLIRACFVQDIPARAVTLRFKDSTHPFYKTVY